MIKQSRFRSSLAAYAAVSRTFRIAKERLLDLFPQDQAQGFREHSRLVVSWNQDHRTRDLLIFSRADRCRAETNGLTASNNQRLRASDVLDAFTEIGIRSDDHRARLRDVGGR